MLFLLAAEVDVDPLFQLGGGEPRAVAPVFRGGRSGGVLEGVGKILATAETAFKRDVDNLIASCIF